MKLLRKTLNGKLIQSYELDKKDATFQIGNILQDELVFKKGFSGSFGATDQKIAMVTNSICAGCSEQIGNELWMLDPIVGTFYKDKSDDTNDLMVWVNKMIKQGAICFKTVVEDEPFIVAARTQITQRQACAVIKREWGIS